MQQVLFRIPFKTAWFPERFPFWAAVVTLAWVVLVIFWVVARLGTPRESGRWSFSSALPWLAAGIGATLLLKRLLTGVEISGGVPIYGFGMMLFLAFLLCTWLASRRAEREGVPARPFRTWPSGYSSADSSAPASRSCCTRTQVLPSCACRMSCCSSGRAASSSTAPSWGAWQGSCCAGGLFFASKAFPP